MLWFFLALTVPFFYIWGVIACIQFFSSKSESKNIKKLLEAILGKLKQLPKNSAVDEIINMCQDGLTKLDDDEVVPDTLTFVSQPSQGENTVIAATSSTAIKSSDSALANASVKKEPTFEFSFSNWYKDNSISILLYIGAFLIVASASVFVGLSWETIGGVSKALVLSVLTLAFLGVGFYFTRIPKIAAAGVTFLSIAAILIPLNGLAWYNFVFMPLGVPIGLVWLCTSGLGLTLYLALSAYLKNHFFVYASNLSILSLVFSVVNTTSLANEFYILGGVMSAFIYLIASIYSKNTQFKDIYSQPLELSAQITMPVSLLLGLFTAAQTGSVVSPEVVIAAALGSLYYALTFYYQKSVWYLLACQALATVAILIFCLTQDLTQSQTTFVLQALAFCFLVAYGYLFAYKKYEVEKASYFLYASHTLSGLLVLMMFLSPTILSPLSYINSFHVLVSAAYFFAAWATMRQNSYITVVAALLLLAQFSACYAARLPLEQVYLTVQITGLIYLFVAHYLERMYKFQIPYLFQLSQFVVFGFGILVSIRLLSYGSLFYWTQVVSLSTITVWSLLSYVWRGNKKYVVVAEVIFLLALFMFGRTAGLNFSQSVNLLQLCGLVYLAISYVRIKIWQKASNTLVICTNILMPVCSLAIALQNLADGKINAELVTSIGISLAFYSFSYVLTRNVRYFIAALFAVFTFAYSFSNWQGVPLQSTWNILEFIALLMFFAGITLRDKYQNEVRHLDLASFIAQALLFFLVYVGFTENTSTKYDLLVFSCIPTVSAATTWFVKRGSISLIYHMVFTWFSCLILSTLILKVSNPNEILGMLYLVVSVVYFVFSYGYKELEKKSEHIFVGGTFIFVALHFALTFANPAYLLAGNIASILFTLVYFQKYRLPTAVYLMATAGYLTVWSALRLWTVPFEYFSLIFIGASIGFYVLGATMRKFFDTTLSQASLVGAVLFVIFFAIAGLTGANIVEKYALVSAYFVVALFATHAWLEKREDIAYFASGLGVFTYLWNLTFLGVSENQMYLIPLGLYFLLLANIQKWRNRPEAAQSLDYGGLFFLLVPLFFQLWGVNHFAYASLMAAEGALLLAAGITLAHKRYTYVGVGAIVVAVLSQTYEFFVTNQWVILALGGVVFLGVALYFLVKRKN